MIGAAQFARMKSTGMPFLPGSSVKGVLRDALDPEGRGPFAKSTDEAGQPLTKKGAEELHFAVFGPPTDLAHENFAPTEPKVVRALLTDYLARYQHGGDRDAWFDGLRAVAGDHGFAPRKASGRTVEQNWREAIAAAVAFVGRLAFSLPPKRRARGGP